MQSLSLVIITKNEALNLARCIESVPFADEIIVVDSESTDGTREIALRYTKHVFRVPWKGFGPTKQAALKRATSDWVLSLDADEALDEELARSIRDVLGQGAPVAMGYRIQRMSMFLGRWIKHSGWYPDLIVRLGQRSALTCTSESVHERLEVAGTVLELKGHLLHYTAPELSTYVQKMHLYADLTALKKFERGRRAGISDLCVRPLYKFCYSYLVRLGFRDGIPGLILAGVSAYYVFIQYARLWELGHETSNTSAALNGDPK